MKESVKLYRFIKEYGIECHIEEFCDKRELVIFVNFEDLPELVDLIGFSFFDDAGQECILKSDYVAINCEIIFNYLGIDLADMFSESEIEKMTLA